MKSIILMKYGLLFWVSTVCLLLLVLLVCTTEAVIAQPPPMFPDEPEQTPIDGGLGILAAIGGTYAIKKLRDRKE